MHDYIFPQHGNSSLVQCMLNFPNSNVNTHKSHYIVRCLCFDVLSVQELPLIDSNYTLTNCTLGNVLLLAALGTAVYVHMKHIMEYPSFPPTLLFSAVVQVHATLFHRFF